MAAEKSSTEEVFFEKVLPFAEVPADGLLKTAEYLESAKCIVQFVDLLGTTFKPVKSDIDGNITKLSKLYSSDEAKYEHLNDIVKVEKETLQPSEFHIGTDALTWLNRALIYNLLFLQQFLQEYLEWQASGTTEPLPEDISRHFTFAYEQSLKKHHGWIVQKIFSLCLMAAPSRGSLLELLGYNGGVNADLPQADRVRLITTTVEKYIGRLKGATEAVSILLLSHGVQP